MNTFNNMPLGLRPAGETDQSTEARRFPWMETVGLTVLIPAFKVGFATSDPFLMEKGFPWLVLVPLLIGLRHGSAHALVSAITLISGISAGLQLGYVNLNDYPAGVTIAFLVLGLIGGEYKTFWATRVERVAESERYHKSRLEQFAKIYHMLKQSHDRLEHQISANIHSIRTALTDLHAQLTLLEPRVGEPFLGASANILKLMSDYGLVQIAGLYEAGPDGRLVFSPVANLGKPLPVEPDDALLLEALQSKQTIAVSPDHETRGTTLMAVVPIVDFSGRLWGAVTINELPFVALEAQNLNLLSAFGGHIGDCLARWSHASAEIPDARSRFEDDLRRALLDAHRCQAPAVVMALSLGTQWNDASWMEKLMLNSRSLDRLLISPNDAGGLSVLALMPNTDWNGAETYRTRMQMMAKTHPGHTPETETLSLKLFPLDRHTDPGDLLTELSPWLPRQTNHSTARPIGHVLAAAGGARC